MTIVRRLITLPIGLLLLFECFAVTFNIATGAPDGTSLSGWEWGALGIPPLLFVWAIIVFRGSIIATAAAVIAPLVVFALYNILVQLT
jgi:hypothetical protein